MSARAALQTLLEEDAALQDLGLEAVYPTNAVDTPAEQFFAIIRWNPTEAAFGVSGVDRFQIWFHDREKDYGRITEGLRIVRSLVPAQTHLSGSDNWVLSTATWRGESDDLYDGGYETLTRYADFDGVSRYATPVGP